LMAEPQVWYSFGNLSVGVEVGISQKQIFPTIGLKWDF